MMIDTQNPWNGALSLWAETGRLLGAARIEATAYLVLMIGYWGLIDFQVLGEDFTYAAMIADFLLGYFLTVALINRGALAVGGLRGTLGTYFLVSLVAGIATLLGLLVLVIPAVILTVRWLPVYGYALVEEPNGVDSLGKAWEATGAYFWPLFIAIMLPMLAMFAPLISFLVYDFSIIFSGDVNQDYSELAGALSTHGALFAGTVLSSVGVMLITAIGIASYSLLRDRSASLNAVFE